jgi:hypothetical protein
MKFKDTTVWGVITDENGQPVITSSEAYLVLDDDRTIALGAIYRSDDREGWYISDYDFVPMESVEDEGMEHCNDVGGPYDTLEEAQVMARFATFTPR